MKVKGYFIHSSGDPSVGIPNARWEITGDIFFEDEKEKEHFESTLKLAFEWVADSPEVETVDEFEQQESELQKSLDPRNEPLSVSLLSENGFEFSDWHGEYTAIRNRTTINMAVDGKWSFHSLSERGKFSNVGIKTVGDLQYLYRIATGEELHIDLNALSPKI